jgi:DNA (cytosine-5)-methyltransferase 1
VFGKYATAIARQEAAFGHPAPPPTEPTGKHGAHRLSPRFVEWMQGCQPGWVTDVPGLTRNDQLKALGNGVVRQQAAAAIRFITTDVETAVAS